MNIGFLTSLLTCPGIKKEEGMIMSQAKIIPISHIINPMLL